MAYEVVKHVGARAYRYSVESYRDVESKKVRANWTYLGAVRSEDADDQPVVRRSTERGNTRDRLLDAFERLVEQYAYGTVTAGAVATEAGLAHGTFYRYFKDKAALLRSAIVRIREDVERGQPSFEPPYGSVAQERARIRSWLRALLERPAGRPGVMRAYYDALETDPSLQTLRLERRRGRTRALCRYLEELARARTIALAEPEPVARALIMLIDAALRARVVKTTTPDDVTIAGVVAVVERAIFS